MELRHLRYFVAVAEELHFGRAAERLFMAQPPLSQQIRQLEAEIGTPLLARTNRRVELTQAGALFLEDARAILRRVEEATTRARRAGRGEAGWLGVGFVASSAYDVLPEILRQFRERLPEVELVLTELLGHEQSHALRERQIHVGFARLPAPEEGIVLETIAQEPLFVALPAGHPLAARERIELADLKGEPLVQFPRSPLSSYRRLVWRLFESAGFTPKVVQETDEVQTAVSLVVAGLGLAVVPEPVRNLRREGIVYRPFADPSPSIDLTMAYREAETSPIVPRFLEIAREVCRASRARL